MDPCKRERLSFSTAVLGIGLIWLWFNVLGAPPVIVEYGAIGRNHDMLTVVASLTWQSVFVLAMLAVGRFACALRSRRAGAGVCAAILVFAFVRAGIELQGRSQVGTLLALIASQVMLALALHLWISLNRERDRRTMLRDTALSFVVGGLLYVPVLYLPALGPALLLVLPPLFSGALLAAGILRQGEKASVGASPPSVQARRAPFWVLTAFVVLAGFVIRPVALLGMLSSPSSIALGMLYAGIVFVFLSLTATRMAFENSFGLISVAVALVVLLPLAFPEPNAIISMLATACWWLCFASLLVAKRPYFLVALYVLAAKVGVLLSELGYNGFYVNLAVAAALLAVAAYLFLTEREGSGRADEELRPGAFQDEAVPVSDFYERCASFGRAMGFTKREAEVFTLLMKGDSARRIAEDLVLSENTIKTHRANVYQKSGVSSRQELLDRFRIFRA